LAAVEKDEKLNKEKLERLLDLYLEGKIPQASFVVGKFLEQHLGICLRFPFYIAGQNAASRPFV
jgi:hypothetical protein